MTRAASFHCLVLAGLSSLSLLANAVDARAQQQQVSLLGPSKFDGTYSIEAQTQDGTCSNTRWTVSVADGQVASVSPNDANITAAGLVEDDGVVSMTFRGGANQVTHVGGQIKGRWGKGTWSSPTLLCGGVWRAQKKR
jgi:hypothetical protein